MNRPAKKVITYGGRRSKVVSSSVAKFSGSRRTVKSTDLITLSSKRSTICSSLSTHEGDFMIQYGSNKRKFLNYDENWYLSKSNDEQSTKEINIGVSDILSFRFTKEAFYQKCTPGSLTNISPDTPKKVLNYFDESIDLTYPCGGKNQPCSKNLIDSNCVNANPCKSLYRTEGNEVSEDAYSKMTATALDERELLAHTLMTLHKINATL